MSNRTTWGAVMSTSDSLSDIDDDRGHGLRRQALLHEEASSRGGGRGNWAESSSLPSSPPPEGSFTAEVDKSPLASQLAAMRLRLVSSFRTEFRKCQICHSSFLFSPFITLLFIFLFLLYSPLLIFFPLFRLFPPLFIFLHFSPSFFFFSSSSSHFTHKTLFIC